MINLSCISTTASAVSAKAARKKHNTTAWRLSGTKRRRLQSSFPQLAKSRRVAGWTAPMMGRVAKPRSRMAFRMGTGMARRPFGASLEDL